MVLVPFLSTTKYHIQFQISFNYQDYVRRPTISKTTRKAYISYTKRRKPNYLPITTKSKEMQLKQNSPIIDQVSAELHCCIRTENYLLY